MKNSKRKKTNPLGIIIPVLIILTGIGILAFPKAKEMYDDYKGDQAIEDFERMLEEGDDISIELDGLDDSDTNDLSLGTQEPENKNFTGKVSVLGILYIDSIDIALPIAEGTDKQSLDGKVAGHDIDTAMPNEKGNCALASHRSVTKNRNFNRLNEVKKNDKIKITARNGTVIYEVYKTYIVPRSDISPLDPPKDKNVKEVTLITCDPIGVNNPPNRIIVKAREVK